jgi:FAD/FMN-containing dehydrogenase
MSSIATAISIPGLRADLSGRVIAPEDADYDAARAVMMGGVDRRPGVIVRVADAADVVRVVSLARDTGIALAVRSGGHSGAAHSVIDDGIVLDLRDLHAIEIDGEARTAWAETGATAAEFTAAAGAHGLATGFGDTGSVGLGGITLGGGIGYLVRAYGLTIDSLLAAEIITADGERIRADADTHSDLFWAIRGGGGNFGVATRFLYRLHPVDQVTGGLLILPATADAVAGFIAAADAAPESLSAIANVMPCPPMPFIPEEHHGKLVILGIMCDSGPLSAGEAVMAPFRALATPLTDMVHPMPYPEIYPPDDPDYHPLAISRTLFVDRFDDDVAAMVVGHLQASDANMRVAQLRVLGGASARVPNEATAYAHRDRRIMVNVASFYDGPDDRAVRERWVTEFAAALAGGDDAGYVNFLADEGEARVRAAYPGATWHRLAAIKARYDPTNLFRSNQNIAPAVRSDRA